MINPQNNPLPIPSRLFDVFRKLDSHGAVPMVVGGAIRDWLLGIEPKDLDIEVYKLPQDKLVSTLQEFGKVDLVGKSFGVIKLTIGQETFDFSLPRRDSKKSLGHKGFEVELDPNLSPLEASSRRDFTINSLFYDPIKNRIQDPHGGIEDIEKSVLRHTSPAFSEDPLRVLRGAQFSARFNLKLDQETANLCRTLSSSRDFLHLPTERIQEEFKKFLLKGRFHLQGFHTLRSTGLLDHFPEIKSIDGLEQDPLWHPEGDTLTHTAHCLSALQNIQTYQNLEDSEKLVYALGVLCHDLGKPYTSYKEWRENLAREVITSPDHPKAGIKPTKSLLKKLGFSPALSQRVELLTLYHMEHLWVKTPKDVRNLAAKLSPQNPQSENPKITETILGLSIITHADHSGRPPLEKKQPEQMLRIMDMADKLGCLTKPQSPLLSGQNLLEKNLKEGPVIGKILKEAYSKQIDGKFSTKDEATKWLKRNFRSLCITAGGPQPLIDGEDLKTLGIPKGEIYGKILSKCYDKQIKGDITTKEEALSWSKNWFQSWPQNSINQENQLI
jgi:tRNA nucleotidyltransferase (CCA-adding enzyme)